MNRFPRDVFRWKFLFYELLLPALRLLGPARTDAILCALGRVAFAVNPRRRAALIRALDRAQAALDLDAPIAPLWPEMAANTVRSLARDYPLDVRDDDGVLARFHVRGREHLEHALAAGNGAILVGNHMGAHIAALHWLFRSGLPVRAMVQRPRHVSRELARRFDAADGPHPQADLFLQRELPPEAAIERMLRARAAIRSGLAMYLCGDIPWHGPNCRTGRMLGHSRRFLAIWTDLAALTRAPVFFVFCVHLPGGEFLLELEAVGQVRRGEEDQALADYLKQLEARIATYTTQAVPYLLWPSYEVPAAGACPVPVLPTRPRDTSRLA